MTLCKYCDEEIYWKQSKNGKWYAVNDENSNIDFHSKTCTGDSDEE